MSGLSVLEQTRPSAQQRPLSIGSLPQLRKETPKASPSLTKRNEWVFNDSNTTRPSVLQSLQNVYVIQSREEIASFVEQNRLTGILIRAIEPLREAFGESAIKSLGILEDGEGGRILYCLVSFGGPLNNARRALESFDRNWWVANARHYGSKLNFDFELI